MKEKNIGYSFGKVDFSAEGAGIEDFYNFCIRNNIEIFNPKKEGYIFCGTVFAKNYGKLRKPAKKFGLRIKIKRKYGIYFFIKKNKNKIGFAFGIPFIFLIIYIMSLFIWEIDVSGNKNISSDEILNSAEKLGLRCGTFSGKHRVDVMEWSILNNNEGLASVEINIQGSHAQIIVNEAFDKAEMVPDDDIPVNIVASRYGIIKKMNVFDGQSAVKVGDAVMKGDLLVSAVFEDRHNKLTLKHARADVIAKTDYIMEVNFPIEQTLKEKGKRIKRVFVLEILGKKIKFWGTDKYNELFCDTEEKNLYFFWLKLPVKLIITNIYDVKEKSITYNFEQAKNGAFALLKEKEENEMKNIEIISRTVEEKIKNNNYILKAEYICLMNIAEEQPIESDVPWQNTDDIS